MSYTYYRTMDLRRDRLHVDFKYPHSCYTTACHTPAVRSPCTEICGNNIGDPSFPNASAQVGRIANEHEARYQDSVEKMQMRLRLLEDSNAVMHVRNQDLITENSNLAKRLEDDATKIEKLYGNISLLQDRLDNDRIKLADILNEQTKNNQVCLEDKCTSSMNIVPTTDRGTQIWEACKDCQRELEGCQREPPTITITKSELDLLERDMRTLRDTLIAREEAWDKAMEREKNCQRQLARLTAETITARHLCETRQDELRTITDALMKRESEIKAIRKETLYLNKLIAKLYRYQKELEEHACREISFSISEKDKKCIEEIAQRVRNTKGKAKIKSKCTTDKHPRSNSSSPREIYNGMDRAGSSEDRRN